MLFIGATYGQEAELAARAGVPFVGLPGRGFLGRGIRAIPAAFDLLRAIALAFKKEREFMPCAVAAFGGYACFAPSLAAIMLRVPLILHEQNAIAGMSNRILSRFAAAVCVSLPNTEGLKKTSVVTGNPVRPGIACPARFEITGKHLLVLGGSQGAHALNKYVVSILPELKKIGSQIRHQTGAKDYDFVRSAYIAAGYDEACVSRFIEDMADAYAWADLALCRAGASTTAELCVAALPSILVPFPAAIHDHQTRNAKVLANAGAALLVPEPDIAKTETLIADLFANPQKMRDMSRACETLAKPDAAARVAAEIEKLCSERKQPDAK